MKACALVLLMTLAAACSESKTTKDEIPAAVTLADGYRLSDQGIFSAKLVWNRPPVAESLENSAELYLRDKDGQTLTSSRLVRFALYMTSMGHPSSHEDALRFEAIDAGHWSVTGIYFSMSGAAGSWAVDLDAEANDAQDHIRLRIDEAVL